MSNGTHFAMTVREVCTFVAVEHGHTAISLMIVDGSKMNSDMAREHQLLPKEARALAADLVRRADEIEKAQEQ